MFLRSLYILFLFLLTSVFHSCATQQHAPFLLEEDILEDNKFSIKTNNEGRHLEKKINQIVRRADKALKKGPWSVVEKEQIPPSGDKHDFLHQATYWWPDPDQPDGLPYIQKDGRTNPDRATDFRTMKRMARSVRSLGLAWYYTREEKYAAHATKLLRVWFLDEETRMNPNLKFVAMIPGRNENIGRGTGLVGTRWFVYMLDGVQLLTSSRAWTENDHRALRGWFTKYTEWMQNSWVGKKGAQQPNNIGTAYDMQLVYYALFTGDENLARQVLTESVPARMEAQFKKDGSQPYELRRTKAWTYSRANLNYWVKLARLAEHVGIDLWAYETPTGKSLLKAVQFLRPYAEGEKEWEYKQITDVNFRSSFNALEKKIPKEHRRKSND